MRSTLRLGAALAACGLSCSSAGPVARGPVFAPAPHPTRATSFTAIPAVKIQKAAQILPPATRDAPLSLTASDGTGLRLVSLRARGVIAGPLAVTQLEARFANPEDRILEGRFAVTLPDGAAVSRLAMKVGDRWQEAEVVERQAARRAYEDFLHRKQDPLLLERDAGNRFQARVFPIPAHGEKEIVLAYSQELADSGGDYRIPLAGLPEIAALDIEVTVDRVTGTTGTVGYTRTDTVPDGDFVLEAPAEPVGLRAGQLVAARLVPPIPSATRPIDSLLILFDTSASQTFELAGQVDALGELIATVAAQNGPDTRILIAAFDQSVEPVFAGRADQVTDATLDGLRRRRALGASDLSRALAFARRQPDYRRVLLYTDGIATAGTIDPAHLRAEVAALAPDVQRIDAICAGGARDRETLTALVRGTLAEDGVVLEADRGARALVRGLTSVAMSGVAVAVADADWVYPTRLDGLQPGNGVLLVARRRPGADPGRLTVDLSGPIQHRIDIPLSPTEPALLERTAARARIRDLTEALARLDPRLEAEHGRLRAEITRLSVAHRVVADTTALLVLETEQDYARFGLARNGLADILTVGQHGLEVIDKRAPPSAVVASGPAAAVPIERSETAGPGEPTGERGESAVVAPGGDRGEVVVIADRAPTIDPSSTTQGITIDADYSRNVPVPGRTFSSALGTAPGSAGDDLGVSFSGSTSLERSYVVDGINTTGESIVIRDAGAGGSSCPANSVRVVERLGDRVNVTCRDSDGRVVPARSRRRWRSGSGSRPAAPDRRTLAEPYTGTAKRIVSMLDHGHSEDALVAALAWTNDRPGDVMALVNLGQVLETRGEVGLAARAYGSLIDLFPGRADLRRFAGERLERLDEAGAALAVDTFQKAVADRPDHLSGHHLLGLALLRQGEPEAAFEAIADGLRRSYPRGRFAGGERILRDDLGLIAAAWTARTPERRKEILERLDQLGVAPATEPSTRFVLVWESDANDVDLHIEDGTGAHAYYQQPTTGEGRLYADVTTGYGPECFAIPATAAAYPYRIGVHYYSRGPMGYGMGKVEVIQHDGYGDVRFEELPFVVMNDGAFVDLGRLDRPL